MMGPDRRVVNADLVIPTDVSRRAAHDGLPAAFIEAGPGRIKYRLILHWRGPSRSGVREETIDFVDPRRLAGLLRKIAASPDRELLSFRIRAMVRPRWCDVTTKLVAFRAAQAERVARERRAR